MFVLRTVDKSYEYNCAIGYSEDKYKLQSMIDQYQSATRLNNKLLDFENCPETIEFGDIFLKKDCKGFHCYKGRDSSKKFTISYGDVLEIEEVCPI